MTWPTVIRTDEQYERALAEIEALMLAGGALTADEIDMLQLLVVLANDYERYNVHFPAPDPVDAILFRLGEQGLTERNLHQHLGGARRCRKN